MKARVALGVRAHIEGAKDSHGNPIESWAEPVERFAYGVYPRYRTEPIPGRSEVVVGLTVLAPAGFEVGPHDRVIYQGREFEVEGEIGDWTAGPYGWQPGIEFALKRVEG